MPWSVELSEEVIEKFWSNVEKLGETACWIYTGNRNSTNYGVVYHGRNSILAHRLSYAIHYGHIPDGKNILHTCDRPPCVQPLHLWPGTHADNVRDMDSKGRRGTHKGYRGEQSPSSKLADAQVADLRQRYAAGGVTQKQLAAELGVTRSAISAWISGKRAGTTSISKGAKTAAEAIRGESHYEGKLTADAVRDFRARYAAGEKLTDITNSYNATAALPVTKQMVWRILHRKAWTHVE